MYITITPQKIGGSYPKSVADFVSYLEKENREFTQDQSEHFFNQSSDQISPQEVIREIDHNTSKLKLTEPKFYSITVNPSKYELSRLSNSSADLKKYTRELMKDYAGSFNREINGKKITVDNIKYYAKIEHHRRYKGTDREIKENQPFATQILDLTSSLRKIEKGEITADPVQIKREIQKLEAAAPHKLNGKRIVQGMLKEGSQGHIHIIVSRKDVSNSYSLSPGSKYKASEVQMNGQTIKRGFDRDLFFERAEKTFDKTFGYKRNLVETYHARKHLAKDPKSYYRALMKLPAPEKAIAFRLLKESGIPLVTIPSGTAQVSLQAIKALKKGIGLALRSSSIGI